VRFLKKNFRRKSRLRHH